MPNSPIVVVGLTRTERSPWRTRSAAAISPLIGRDMCVASVSPIHTAASNSSRATMTKIMTKVMRIPSRLCSSRRYWATAISVRWISARTSRIEKAADHQIGIDEAVELDRGANPVVALGGQQDDLAPVRLLDRLPGHQIELQRQAERRLGDDPSVAVHHHRLGKRPHSRLVREELIEQLRIAHQGGRLPIEIVGHRECLGADALPVLAEIGLGDRARRLDGGAHPLAEPRLDAEIEEQRREHGDENCRRDRDQAEQDDDAHVQAGPGEAAPPLRPDAHELANDDRAQQQQQDGVDIEENDDGLADRDRSPRRQSTRIR